MSRYRLKQYEKEHMKMAMLKQEETFRQQVHELHRLYRVQQLLMSTAGAAANETTMAMPPTAAAATRCTLEEDDEDERRAAENDAGSSRSWDGAASAYSRQQQGNNNKAAPPPPLVLHESELELTLSLGCFGTPAGKKAAAKKEASSSSVDLRTSVSSSSTESGTPDDCGVRMLPTPSSLVGSVPAGQPTSAGNGSVGQRRLEQEAGLPQPPPWLHKCLNLAR